MRLRRKKEKKRFRKARAGVKVFKIGYKTGKFIGKRV
jgi:hypothetical protein